MVKSVSSFKGISEYVKGLLTAIIITLVMVLIFAAVIKFWSVDSQYIPIINQVIKSLSIVISMLICFSAGTNGWLRGLLFGVLYILLSFLIFSAFNGSFDFGIKLLNDCLLGGITGAISGIIVVNVKKQK